MAVICLQNFRPIFTRNVRNSDFVSCRVWSAVGVRIQNANGYRRALLLNRLLVFKRTFKSSLSSEKPFLHIGEDNLVRQLLESSSVDGVFVLVNAKSVLSPSEVATAFHSLDRLISDQICALPWAIYDRSIMFHIQCFANQETNEIFQPILQCPEFGRLCREAQRLQTSFTAHELVSVTLCLLRLHVDPHSEVFRNLLLECQQRHRQFDLKTLVLFSDVANLLKRPGFYLSSQIVQVLQQRWARLEMSHDNFVDIAKILFSTGYFFTKDTLIHFQDRLFDMMWIYRDVVHSSVVLQLLEPLSRFVGVFNPELLALSLNIVGTRVDELGLWHLSRAALFLQAQQCTTGSLHDTLCQKAVEMLKKENLRAADIVSLITLHSILHFPGNSQEALEMRLGSCIQDLDVILLKLVSHSYLISSTTDTNLIQAFCRRAQHKIKDLADSVSCLLAVTHCLAKTPARPPDFDRIFSHFLLRHLLDHQLGTQPKHVATIGRYLVQCLSKMDSRSGQLLIRKLLRTLPNFTLLDIANISLGVFSYSDRETRTHSEELMTNFAREVLQRTDEIDHINLVNLLVKAVFSKIGGIFRDAVIHDLAGLYVTHAHSIDLSSVIPTASLLGELRLYLPDVCERLVKIIIDNHSAVTLPAVAQTLELLAKVNHRPSNLTALQEIATGKISELEQRQDNVIHMLVVASSLVVLQVYPEELIKRIFSLKFLSCLDNLVMQDGFRRKRTRHLGKLLAELNRSVVLQCPEIDVAWFCSRYCEHAETKLESSIVKKWRNTMYFSLIDALGGDQFVKQGPLQTAYCHTYDFECLLDQNGSPLPFNSQEAHERVAILLTMPYNFCANDRRLLGIIDNKFIQLEILGFKVVEVPYYHLDSMMLSDPEARQAYFRNKVLK